jgi:hypothetical protein
MSLSEFEQWQKSWNKDFAGCVHAFLFIFAETDR